MNRDEIKEQLQPIAREIFSNPNLIITDELDASNISNWTSLTFTMFLTKIENVFGIKFKMMELLKLKNMGEIINSIMTHLG